MQTPIASAVKPARPAVRAQHLLAVLLVLAAALRLATLGVQSLDADEGYTWEIAHRSLGGALAQIPHTESTPPLYYLAVWLWARLFGFSEFALRSLSALAGTAAVATVYAIGRELRSRTAGLVAASLAAVSPLLVWYSQEARAYMLFMLLATVSFWLFLRALAEPRWLRWWAVASIAAIATHYFALVTIVPEAVWLLARAPRRRAALPVAAVAASLAALMPLLLYQVEHVSRPWAAALSVGDELASTGQSFLVGLTWTALIHRAGVAVIGALLVLLVAFAVRRASGAVKAPLGIAAFAILVPFALSLVGPKYFTPGNELGVWPLIAVIAGVGATTGTVPRVLGALACAAMLAVTVAVPFEPALQRADWRGLVGTLNRLPGPRAVVGLPQPPPVARYYLARQGPPRPAREIAVLAEAPVSTIGAPVAGMQLLGGRVLGALSLARFGAPTPVRPPGAALYQR